MVIGGKSYPLGAGFCEQKVVSRPAGSARAASWVFLGLITNASRPAAAGLFMVMTPGQRPRLMQITDGEINAPGVRLAIRGSATVLAGSHAGTFSAVEAGSTQVRATGSWHC